MPKFVVDGTYAGHRPSADGSNRVVDFIVNDHRVTCPRCNNKEREIEVECCAGGAFISLTHSETVADGIEIDTVPHAYATQRIAPHEIG